MFRSTQVLLTIPLFLVLTCCVGDMEAALAFRFQTPKRLTNQELSLQLSTSTGGLYRIETSVDLQQWNGLVTLRSSGAGVTQHIDAAAPFLAQRFYRAVEDPRTNAITGDHLPTNNGDVVMHPINHASAVLSWNGKFIYNDPVVASRFQGIPRADLILISHDHSDHMEIAAITSLKGPNAVIIAPASVYSDLPVALQNITTVLANGGSASVMGVIVEAVPMYNITPARLQYHAQGDGNGYILNIGGKRIYLCGDTEDTTEMRALQNIDVAFLCMNLPYTMTVTQAASAVRVFRPKVVYPYHYSSSNVGDFKRLVGTDLGIEVRLRQWY